MKNTDVWIGLVEVKPLPGNDALGRAQGAFVNVVALSTSEIDYFKLVKDTMNENGFTVVSCKDAAPLDEWRKTNVVREDIRKLAASLTPEVPIQFDEFQSFRHEADA